jgi:ABC-type transport system substrate-binding protein
MRSIPRKISAALVLLAGSPACSAELTPPIGKRRDVPPQRGGTLRTAFLNEVRGLDPVATFDSTSTTMNQLLYDVLVTYDDAGKIVPQLAERYDVSPDGKRYAFTLRRGVRFHDGSELTAADVKRSIERALHPKTPCPIPTFYARIRGYAAFHDDKAPELEGVRVEGDYQLGVELTEPDATLLYVLALTTVAPLCKSAGRTYDRNFSSRPCGTGPFKLVEFEQGQVIRFVRHDGYWDTGKPYLDGITWYLSMQQLTQRFKFQEGALDYMREFTEADSTLFRSDARWRAQGEWEPSMLSAGVFMNTELPPFDDRHVRRAVAYALDHAQPAMVRPGHVEPQPQLVPRAILQMPPGTKLQRHDYRAALQEMRLAGYAYDPNTGKGGYPKEIPYVAILESFAQNAAEIYQQQLAKIGIKIRLQIVGWPTYLARTARRKTAQMGYAGWAADYPEPSDFYEPLLLSSSIQDEESSNHAFFSNAEFDGIVAKARRSIDPKERNRLYQRAEEIVASEAPWALGYSYRYYESWQPYVHGYRPHAILNQYVRFTWLDRAEQRRSARIEPWYLPLKQRQSRGSLAAVFGAPR